MSIREKRHSRQYPHEDLLRYAIMGAAALRPGLLESELRAQRALDENAELISSLRAELAGIEEGQTKSVKRIESSKRVEAAAVGGTYGWSSDPVERKREMKRRMAKRKKAKLHPRDERHPDHQKWMAKIRKAAKKRWNAMTEAEQEKHKRKMKRGRRRQMQGNESVRSMLSKVAPPPEAKVA